MMVAGARVSVINGGMTTKTMKTCTRTTKIERESTMEATNQLIRDLCAGKVDLSQFDEKELAQLGYDLADRCLRLEAAVSRRQAKMERQKLFLSHAEHRVNEAKRRASQSLTQRFIRKTNEKIRNLSRENRLLKIQVAMLMQHVTELETETDTETG